MDAKLTPTNFPFKLKTGPPLLPELTAAVVKNIPSFSNI